MHHKVWIYAGNIPFCRKSEIYDAMAEVNPDAVRSEWVSSRVAALIICYCCGFPMDATCGGKPITQTREKARPQPTA